MRAVQYSTHLGFVGRRGQTPRHYIEQERGRGFRRSMVREDLERRAVQSRSYYREQVGSAGVISSAMCRCNGSQNFGTAGGKRGSIIWNKSRTLSSAQTNYCPFGLPMFSLINSSYVRGSKAIRYRPSSNHKRCQLAICRRFLCRLGRKLPGNQSIWVPGEVWLQS